jgi:hypothetical protein
VKRFGKVLLFGGIVVLAVLFGLFLGSKGSASNLWLDLQSLLGRKTVPPAPAEDPALKAGLPAPDPTAGLPPSPLNGLLKPGLTPEEQTSIVGQMLIDYWTNTHTLPNGTWEEICAQLSGSNPKKLALVPRQHPALGKDAFAPSPDGPGIRLHVISSSGCAFQLIYDGPDHQPYTDDDLVRNFPPDLKF